MFQRDQSDDIIKKLITAKIQLAIQDVKALADSKTLTDQDIPEYKNVIEITFESIYPSIEEIANITISGKPEPIQSPSPKPIQSSPKSPTKPKYEKNYQLVRLYEYYELYCESNQILPFEPIIFHTNVKHTYTTPEIFALVKDDKTIEYKTPATFDQIFKLDTELNEHLLEILNAYKTNNLTILPINSINKMINDQFNDPDIVNPFHIMTFYMQAEPQENYYYIPHHRQIQLTEYLNKNLLENFFNWYFKRQQVIR